MRFSQFLGATALAGALALIPNAAFAQATDAKACENATADKSDCGQVPGTTTPPPSADGSEDIVVTGSHIHRARDQFNTADSIQVISKDESTQLGFTSTGQILQSTAVTGGTSQINNAYGGYVTAGGGGANTLSLRGLGTTRTLILLNGRRMAPAGSRGQVGAVDLNTLPSVALDRIEVLNTGASSVYGSDAVAGVVNVITRTKVKGIEASAQVSEPTEGGGMQKRIGVLFGTSGDNFNLMGSLEYYKQSEITYGDRPWAQCQTDYRIGASGVPDATDSASGRDPFTGAPKCYGTGVTGEGGVTVNTLGTRNIAGNTVALGAGVPAGYTGTCNRFRPNPLVTTGALPGYECVGGGTLSLNVRDTFPQSLLRDSLISPVETYTGFFSGSYRAAPGVELYAEVLGSRRKSLQNSNRQLTIDYPQGSLLVPANLRGDTFLPAQAGGITGTNAIAARVFADYGNYQSRQTDDFVKGVVGVRGDFGRFHYDGYAMKSWSDATYTTDLVLTSRIAQSLDVVQNADGSFSCRNTLGGCVAAPPISAAVIGGTFPQAWFNWINTPVIGTTKYRETTFALNVDGPLFHVWGGDVAASIGVEHRSNSIDDEPSTESVNNNLYGFTSSSVTKGSDAVTEVYGELEVPLLKNIPVFHTLTFNGSGRYTNYRSYGSQWTYKAGGQWELTKFFALRGSYGTSYRAPALYEQFLGATSGFQSGQGDPCNNYGALADQTAPRVKNCASLGISPTFQATNSIQVNQVGGAASGLKAEKSKAFTAGGVLSPKFGRFGNLSLSADYFNITVSNGVSQLSYSTILSQCYDRPDFPNFSLCNLIQRSASAPYSLTVTTGYVNIATSKVAGWDFNLRYAVPVFGGNFRLTAAVTKYNRRYSQTLPTDTIFDNVGTLNNPEWTGTFEAYYNINKVSLRYQLDWIEKTYSSANYIGATQAVRDTYIFQTPNYFTHAASIQFAPTDRYSMTIGVRNLFDTYPPSVSSGAYNRAGNAPLYSGYDWYGRTVFMNVSTKF